MLRLYMRSQSSAEICLNWRFSTDAITGAVKGELLPDKESLAWACWWESMAGAGTDTMKCLCAQKLLSVLANHGCSVLKSCSPHNSTQWKHQFELLDILSQYRRSSSHCKANILIKIWSKLDFWTQACIGAETWVDSDCLLVYEWLWDRHTSL